MFTALFHIRRHACIPRVLAPALLLSASVATSADVQLIAKGTVPGTARDLSGMSELIAPDRPHDLLGAFGSAIDYTGADDVYWAVADRGPLDGAAPFRCRMHQFRFSIVPGADGQPGVIDWAILKTVLLTDERGLSCMGGSRFINIANDSASRRFDPEGMRLSASGTSVFLSDEYGPHVDEFGLDGRRIRRIPIPASASIDHASADPDEEMPPRNRRGRQPNRGFEGLALSPDGTTLWIIPQSPLIQDGGLDDKLERAGINIRVVKLDLASGKANEYLYLLADKSLGINEMLAVDDQRFLLIERDGKAGEKARIKNITLADFTEATDISSIDQLPRMGMPPGVVPARSEVFIDLLDPRFGLLGKQFPAKIEAITFGPRLPDGRHTLLVASDNDMRPEEPTSLWMFAFQDQDLPGIQLRQPASKP